jgi:hypothetical protein
MRLCRACANGGSSGLRQAGGEDFDVVVGRWRDGDVHSDTFAGVEYRRVIAAVELASDRRK